MENIHSQNQSGRQPEIFFAPPESDIDPHAVGGFMHSFNKTVSGSAFGTLLEQKQLLALVEKFMSKDTGNTMAEKVYFLDGIFENKIKECTGEGCSASAQSLETFWKHIAKSYR